MVLNSRPTPQASHKRPTEAKWIKYRVLLERLFVEENKTVPEIVKYMRERYDLEARFDYINHKVHMQANATQSATIHKKVQELGSSKEQISIEMDSTARTAQKKRGGCGAR